MILTAGSSLWCFAIEPESGCGRSKPRDITTIPAQLWRQFVRSFDGRPRRQCSGLDSDNSTTRTTTQAEAHVCGMRIHAKIQYASLVVHLAARLPFGDLQASASIDLPICDGYTPSSPVPSFFPCPLWFSWWLTRRLPHCHRPL